MKRAAIRSRNGASHSRRELLDEELEALREAQQATELSRARYADLYDYAPVGYVIFDAIGIVKEVNITAAEMLGQRRAFILKSPFNMFVATEDRKKFMQHLL